MRGLVPRIITPLLPVSIFNLCPQSRELGVIQTVKLFLNHKCKCSKLVAVLPLASLISIE